MRLEHCLRSILVACAAAAAIAQAADAPTWPPSPEVLARMRELQAVIANPATSKSDREKARAEIGNLMKSPAGQDRKTPEEAKKPARAAIDPYPSVVKPAPPVARIEVVQPPPATRPADTAPRPAPDSIYPRKPPPGVVAPSPDLAVNPRNGHLLQEIPGGWVDPRTGQFIPATR